MQSVSVSQKVPAYNGTVYCYSHNTDPAINDGQPIPNPGLVEAFNFIDAQLGEIIAALKAKNLFASTTIIVTAKHGQNPRDPNLVRPLPPKPEHDVL